MRTTIWAACLLACSQAVSTSVMNHLSAAIAPTTPSALGEILAQTSQEIGKEHSCDYAQQRLRQDLPDVYDILMAGETYTDESFPFRDAFYWADQDPWSQVGLKSYVKYGWKRAYDEFPEAKLFGKDGGHITPGDIRQGYFGDCWWLGSVSALAEVPNRVENIIVNQENDPNAAGIYAFNLYALGMPITITVDDYLPILDSEEGLSTIGAHLGDDHSLWMPLLEKAFAKFVGNYYRTEGGLADEALSYLTNAPTQAIEAPWQYGYSLVHILQPDELWNFIVAFDGNNGIMTAGTLLSQGYGDNYTPDGLAKSHLYSLLGYVELSNGVRLLKMRNPWGSEVYQGPYKDGSDDWTEELRSEVDTPEANDGVFYIPIENFVTNYSLVEFHYDTTQQYTMSSTFMRLDDELVDESQKCGEGCLEHNLTLSLDEGDSPFLTLNFWNLRFYAQQDLNYFDITYDLVVDGVTLAEDEYAINYNNFQLDDLEEGEHDVMLRIMRNSSPDEFPHDWSITAHSNGEVNLFHKLQSLTTSTWNTLSFRDKVEQGAASSNRDTSSSVQGDTRFNLWADWIYGKLSQNREEATVQHQILNDYQEADSDRQIIALTGVNEGSDMVAKVGVTMTNADWDSLRYSADFTSSPEECEESDAETKTCFYYLVAEEPYVAFQSDGASFDVFRVSEEYTSRDSIPSDAGVVEGASEEASASGKVAE